MSSDTKIEWTDATWNPIRGCSRVSQGCVNCYAEKVAARFSGPGLAYEGLAANGKWTGQVRLVIKHLEDPLRWQRPRRIFVNSMSDLFHESLSNEQIAAVFGVMAAASQHTFQVLTKRPARTLEWFQWADAKGLDCKAVFPDDPHGWRVQHCMTNRARHFGAPSSVQPKEVWPLPNVWLGVSVENQAAADERIPLLLQTPAAKRFLSCEPLLGPVDVSPWLTRSTPVNFVPFTPEARAAHGEAGSRLLHQRGIDWVIAGGESGYGARPMHAEWARSLRDQCAAASAPFFFKQWGEWAPLVNDGGTTMMRTGKKLNGRILDGRKHSEFPR